MEQIQILALALMIVTFWIGGITLYIIIWSSKQVDKMERVLAEITGLLNEQPNLIKPPTMQMPETQKAALGSCININEILCKNCGFNQFQKSQIRQEKDTLIQELRCKKCQNIMILKQEM